MNEGLYSKDYERVVLGQMFNDSESVDTAINMLTENSFYYPQHAIIFKTMKYMYETNMPINQLTVYEVLKQQKNNSITQDDVDSITGDVISTANTEHYCEELVKYAQKRELTAISNVIEKNVLNPSINIVDFVGTIQSQLTSVVLRDNKKTYVSSMEASQLALTEIERLSTLGGRVDGIVTGFSKADSILQGLRAGNFIVLAGKTSQGKSALAQDIALNVARSGVPVMYYTLEMSVEELAMRAVGKEARFNMRSIPYTGLKGGDWTVINGALGRLANIPIYYYNTPGMHITEFYAKSRQAIREKNIGFIVIDYMQLMRGESGEGRRLEIESITRGLKTYAQELKVPILALSQFSRRAYSDDTRRPKLSDLKESSSIEQDADVVILIHNGTQEQKEKYDIKADVDSMENVREIRIEKHRNGATGLVYLYWFGEYAKFANLDY